MGGPGLGGPGLGGPVSTPNLGGAQPTAGAGQSGSIGELTRSILADLGSIRSEIANSRAPDITAIFAAQSSSILKLLDEQERFFRKQAEQEGTTQDPATQFAINELRESLGEQLKAAREDLNRRGILESGITLDVEAKIRKGQVSAEGRILAERLSRIQNTLRENLSRLSGQRVQTASQFGIAGAQGQVGAELDERRRRDDLIGRLVAAQQNERNFLGEEDRFGRGLAFQGEQSAIDRLAQATQQQRGFEFQAGQQQNQQTFQAGQQQIANQFTAEQNRLQAEAANARAQADQAARRGDAQAEQQWRTEENRLDRAAQFAAAQATAARRQAEQQEQQQQAAPSATVRDEIEVLYGAPTEKYPRGLYDGRPPTREEALAFAQQNAAQLRGLYGEQGYQQIVNAASKLPSGADVFRGVEDQFRNYPR